jgi:GT2 family glycosyltransferase
MVGWFTMPDVGVVGARLLRPNGTVQHGGVVIGARRGLPQHLFEGLDASDPGFMCRARVAQNVSAVTGACLLTRTALYRTLDGFDAAHLGVQYNDVDYCLRVTDAGFRIVFEPGATLLHETSASRRGRYTNEENSYFRGKYGSRHDPYWSPHLDHWSLAMPTPRLKRA